MKWTLILSFAFITQLANAQVLQQLTNPEAPLSDKLETMEIHYGGMSRNFTIGDDGTSLSAKVQNQYGIISFTFAAKNQNGSTRLWLFDMPERARQAMKINIQDDFGNTTVGDSARLLETAMYFFPRRVVPSVTSSNGTMEVTLPTGETVQFDSRTKEIVGGVLEETAPLDMTFDRSKRKFAQLAYHGEGVVIRADRRSGTPEAVHAQVFNVNEDIKNATITYQGKTCKVAKNLIWDQHPDRANYFLFATDEEFYEKILKAKCGWSGIPL